jgi:hypothetical protein
MEYISWKMSFDVSRSQTNIKSVPCGITLHSRAVFRLHGKVGEKIMLCKINLLVSIKLE